MILGGALIDLAGRDDRAGEMLERLLRNLVREQDRAVFDGWDWRVGSGEAVKDETAQREAAGSGDADGGATPDPAAEHAPTRRRFIVPSNPNLYKEFLAQRRAGLSEE